MSKVYGIVGTGTAAPKAIWAALEDLEDDATFVVPYGRTPGLELVYDWLIDNEKKFSVVGNPGKTIREYAAEVIPAEGGDLNMIVLDTVQNDSPTILVLWEDNLEKPILSASAKKFPILELTNGLLPISVEEDEKPQPEVKVEVEAEPEVEEERTFSKEELEAMPIAAVKRYTVNNSDIDIKGKSKEEIISSLFPETTEKVVPASILPDIPEERNKIKISFGNSNRKSFDNLLAPAEEIPSDNTVKIIIVMASGTTVTIDGNEDTMRRILSVI